MILDLMEVARAMGAAGDPHSAEVTGWSVDTRALAPGDLYFALRGPNHDGHNYAAQALSAGAMAAVVERDMGLRGQLIVPDALRALQQLAGWARKRWGGRVVGVTGSAGKTTTKDAIAHLLAVGVNTGKTVGNFNNHVGVPLSILRLPGDCRAAVLEMGMNHAGELRELACIAKPDIGVVTNVGYAHVEFFGSIDGVAAAKRELIEGLPDNGIAVLNADDERVLGFREVHRGKSITFGLSDRADVRAQAVELREDGASFKVAGVEFESAVPGRHAVMNFLAAIAVAGVFGIAPERLRKAVRSFAPGRMRGERMERNGMIIWNDCYNSNPEAARSMIDVLKQTPARRRIAVLGEMMELGAAARDLHLELGRYAAQGGVDLLVGVRGNARLLVEGARVAGLDAKAAVFFDDPAVAGGYVKELAAPGDALLFKGSRGVRVELALEKLLS
jgi:UDP-N-acetylmuramoyl-tripeptide--D-alanyl-D-alanine ligase